MNSTKTLLAALAGSLTLLSSAAFASDTGLLGRHYAGADLMYENYTSSRIDDTFGGRVIANMPFTPKVDAAFEYQTGHTSGANLSATHHDLSLSAITFNPTEYGKAYLLVTVGHTWERVRTFGVSTRDNAAFWTLGAGYEMPFGEACTVNARLSYTDAFQGDSFNQVIYYRLEASRWFNPQVAGVVSAGYKQIKNSPDATAFTVGLRWSL